MNNNFLTSPKNLDGDTFRKLENKIWYNGGEGQLIAFYRNTNQEAQNMNVTVNSNHFYTMMNKNNVYKMPVLHFDLPKMITKSMVNLTFCDTPKYRVSHSRKTKQAENLTETLYDIYNDNNHETLFQRAAELLSYSGAIAFKVIVDEEFSEYPILEVYPKEDFSVTKKYGRVTEVIFEDYYTKGEDRYVLKSVYGKGYITYKLYKFDEDKQVEVNIETIDETKGLSDIKFDQDKKAFDRNMLSVYMENKNNAQSDYHGCITDFQAIDEIYSNMVNYVRKSKIKTYYPESLCQKDNYGNKIINDDYDTDNIILFDSNLDDAKVNVQRDSIDILNNLNGYNISMQERIGHCLRTTGLSMTTLGFAEGSANSSGVALEIRETMTARTRAEKNKRWSECIESLNELLLSVHLRDEDKDFTLADITDYDFSVEFAEYIKPTMEGITELLASQLNAGLIDRRTALVSLYPDLSEEAIDEMYLAIEKESYNSLPETFDDEEDIEEVETNEDESEDE